MGAVYKLLVLVSQSGRCQSRERSVCESKSFETQNTFDLGKRLQKSVCFATSKRSDASWKVFQREPHSCLSSQVWWAQAGTHNTWGSSEHHWQSVPDIPISNALINSIAMLKVWLLPIAKTSNTTKGSTNKSQSIFYTSCLPIFPIPLPCYGRILAIISQACNEQEHCMVGSRLHTLSHCTRYHSDGSCAHPQFYGSFQDCLGFRNRLGKPPFECTGCLSFLLHKQCFNEAPTPREDLGSTSWGKKNLLLPQPKGASGGLSMVAWPHFCLESKWLPNQHDFKNNIINLSSLIPEARNHSHSKEGPFADRFLLERGTLSYSTFLSFSFLWASHRHWNVFTSYPGPFFFYVLLGIFPIGEKK